MQTEFKNTSRRKKHNTTKLVSFQGCRMVHMWIYAGAKKAEPKFWQFWANEEQKDHHQHGRLCFECVVNIVPTGETQSVSYTRWNEADFLWRSTWPLTQSNRNSRKLKDYNRGYHADLFEHDPICKAPCAVQKTLRADVYFRKVSGYRISGISVPIVDLLGKYPFFIRNNNNKNCRNKPTT